MSGEETIPIQRWLWGAIGVVILGIASWTGSRVAELLNQHSTQLVNHEVRLVVQEKTTDKIDAKLDRILEQLQANK